MKKRTGILGSLDSINNYLMTGINQPSPQFQGIGFNPTNAVYTFNSDECNFHSISLNSDSGSLNNR